MVSAMHKVEEEFKVKITFSIEDEPLGTGLLSCVSNHKFRWSAIIGKRYLGIRRLSIFCTELGCYLRIPI